MEKLFKKINLDDRLINIYKGKITPPDFEYIWKPVENFFYPFPPCLIPIFVDNGDPRYFGLVKHFFIDRLETFGIFNLQSGYIRECARNTEQYFGDLIFTSISIEEDITDEILEFTKQINFNPTKEIWEYLEQGIYQGNPFESHHKLSFFTKETPLSYCTDINKYNGDFISSKLGYINKNISNACGYEMYKGLDIRKVFEELPWLNDNSDKKNLFGYYLKKNMFKEAWLTLNSVGWVLKDVQISLKEFKTKTNNELFHIVADNWINGVEKANKQEEKY